MNIAEYLRESPGGKLSASRLLLLVWGLGIFLIWAFVSFQQRELVNIPPNVITLLGIVVGAKTVQRFGENQS